MNSRKCDLITNPFQRRYFFARSCKVATTISMTTKLIAGITRRSLYIFIYYNQLGLQ